MSLFRDVFAGWVSLPGGIEMDQITQFFISSYDNVLNIGFVCNLMIFCACFEAISVAIGHMASIGK